MSLGHSIRVAVQGLIVAANLSGIPAANIRVRMMTKATKGIDKFPIVVISPYGTIGDKPADFEGSRDRQFRVRIAIIDVMSGDTETNDELYAAWIEAALNAVVVASDGTARMTLAGVSGNWQIWSEAVTTFDDSKMEAGLIAFQNAVIRFDLQ